LSCCSWFQWINTNRSFPSITLGFSFKPLICGVFGSMLSTSNEVESIITAVYNILRSPMLAPKFPSLLTVSKYLVIWSNLLLRKRASPVILLTNCPKYYGEGNFVAICLAKNILVVIVRQYSTVWKNVSCMSIFCPDVWWETGNKWFIVWGRRL